VGAFGHLVPVLTLLSALDILISVLRTVLFAGSVLIAAVAAVAYAVRTRRLNPFGAAARFTRGTIDPLLAPIERRIVRAGGRPTSAPWWALAAVVVVGIIVISVLGFVREQIATATLAATMGPRGLAALLVQWTFGLLQIALLVRVISSWFQVSPYSPWVRWSFGLTDWILQPLRQVIPPLGMMDVTPIVAYFALALLERFVLSVL
jgi:YggT family protein